MAENYVSKFNRICLGHNTLEGSTVRVWGAVRRDSDIPNLVSFFFF